MGVIGIVAVVVTAVVVALSVVSRAGRPAESPSPRLSPGLAPNLLARAGFPATAHNVAVLHDHLGRAFLEAARGMVPGEALAALDRRCTTARGGVPVAGGSSRAWPQRVLDELAAAGATDVVGLPRHCQETLLATSGTGRGIFGGSVFAPLPVLPDAAPAAPSVPAPRTPVQVAGRAVPA
ncbi:hypothetical protein [Actinomycetospora atypica]|uniref:Uncharacterized protein n=1 Tax=Actinomycetospora atypica TaxID=1290095 RepID=A0ABV9YX21_9PSEU